MEAGAHGTGDHSDRRWEWVQLHSRLMLIAQVLAQFWNQLHVHMFEGSQPESLYI